jgi:hypothetical protein
VLVIWIGQLHTNNDKATDEVIKEQVKIFGQQMSVTNSVHKTCMYFAPKNEITVNINRPTV